MALLVGLAFLVDWLLVDVFNMDSVKSLLATALIFIVLGLLVDGYPLYKGRLGR